VKPAPVQNNQYNFKAFEDEGQFYSAGRIEDTKRLSITDYSSQDKVLWDLESFFNSDFQPLVIYLLFDLESKLNSFVIKLGIYKADKLSNEITIDISNCQNCGKTAIYSFQSLILPANSQILFGSNQNIQEVQLFGKVSYLGPSFNAEKAGNNDDTYNPLPFPIGQGITVYPPDEIVPLATELEFYDAARNNGIFLYPFTIPNYLTAKAVGAVFDLGQNTSETLDIAFYSSDSNDAPKDRLTNIISISTSISGFFFTEFLKTFSPYLLYWFACKYQGTVASQRIETSSIREYTGNSFIFDQNENRQLEYGGGDLDTLINASSLSYSNKNPYQIYLQVN